jgi:4-amino-4-deoxy-L-arabinose transferase-like glycosyltransferase
LKEIPKKNERGGLDFSSIPTIIGFILGAALLDALLMFWLRARKKPKPRRDEVYVLGGYSPLLTRLRRAPALIRLAALRMAHPGTALRELAAGFTRWVATLSMRLAAGIRKRSGLLRIALMVIAVGCGLAGQIQLFGDHNLPGGLPWIVFSAAAWLVWCLFYQPDVIDLPHSDSEENPPAFIVKRRDFRNLAIILALQMTALAVALYWNRPPKDDHWDIFGLWAAGMVLYLLAFWPAFRGLNWLENVKTNWKRLLPFVLIFLLAAGLRFYRLGDLPPIMENDEGTVGVRTLEVIAGLRRNMFDVYGGYGALYFFLQSLPVAALGRSVLALRLVTALAGTLTIPLTAWMGWRLFGYKTALAASAMLAASHLHIHFSRVSPTAGSFDPLFSTALAWLFYEALTRRRPHLWAAAGLVMGVGMHFYVGARVMPLICLAVLLGLLVLRRDLLRGQVGGLLVLTGGLLVTSGPLLSWALRHPDGFNQRINQVGIYQNGWLDYEMALFNKSLWQVLAEQFGNALLIFNYHSASWFYQAAAPALGLLGGLLLLFGLLYSLTRLRRLPYLIVSAWFWVTLTTGQVLMMDPPTNAYRTLGLLPAACLMMAAAAIALTDEVERRWKKFGRLAAAGLLAALVLVEGGWNIWYYYGSWTGAGTYGDDNTRRASVIGSFLGEQPPGKEIIIASGPEFNPDGWLALEYLKGNTTYLNIQAPLAKIIPALAPSRQAVVVVPAQMQAELDDLKIRYPAGQATPHSLEGKLYFWSFVLNGE